MVVCTTGGERTSAEGSPHRVGTMKSISLPRGGEERRKVGEHGVCREGKRRKRVEKSLLPIGYTRSRILSSGLAGAMGGQKVPGGG